MNSLDIPVFNKNVAFNSILIASLYSQYSQQVIAEESKKWDETNEFLKKIKKIVVDFASSLKEFSKINSEEILLQFITEKKEWLAKYILDLNENLQKINPTVVLSMISQKEEKQKEETQETKKEVWYQDYISNFYKLLNISCLTVIYNSSTRQYLVDNLNSNNYDEIKTEIDNMPKIILLYHSDVNDKAQYFIQKYEMLKKEQPDEAGNLKLSNYNISIKGLDTFEDTITFNCQKYKLDSCLIDNKYATTGITCNDKRIVYNHQNTNQLIDFNWNIKNTANTINKFCFKKEQEEGQHEQQEECLSFNEGVRLFVYVKNDNDKEVKPSSNKNAFSATSPETINEIIVALAKLIQEKK